MAFLRLRVPSLGDGATSGTQTLSPSLFTGSGVFYSPVVTLGPAPQTLVASLFTGSGVFYDATVTPGDVTVSPGLLTGSGVFYDSRIDLVISGILLTGSGTFFSATVTAGDVSLSPPLLTGSGIFYGPVVTFVGDVQNLIAPLLTGVGVFFDTEVISPSVYMSNPNLTLRWEIIADGTVASAVTMEALCGTIASEGGYDITGITAAADSGTAGLSIAAGATGELIAIRLQSAFTEFATAFVQVLSIINATSGNFRWRLVLNPTETVAGSWGAVSGSVLEANTTRTVTAGTGIMIASGYSSSSQNEVSLDARPVLTLGTTLAGVTDVISLQVTNLQSNSDTFFGSLTWREIY